MTKPAMLRAGLLILVALQVVLGGWALFFPRGFYDGFPAPGHPWVAMLPPFNEHLVRDVGGLSLAFAFLFAVGAVTLHPQLTRPILLGYEFFAVPHLIFHTAHLHDFPMVDRIGQTASLAFLVALPLALIPLTAQPASAPDQPPVPGKDRAG